MEAGWIVVAAIPNAHPASITVTEAALLRKILSLVQTTKVANLPRPFRQSDPMTTLVTLDPVVDATGSLTGGKDMGVNAERGN